MRIRFRTAATLAILVFLPAALFAKCPITPNATLEVKAKSGNLIIDLTGTDSVEVEVSNRLVPVEECGRDRIVLTDAGQGQEIPDWKIRVPKAVSLDLTTFAGSITVNHDVDGSVIFRTTGGRVTAPNIAKDATVFTPAGEITLGNVGGDAELRSGRSLVVGNVGGKAILTASAGDIRAGFVKGSVTAETGGGNIEIRESDGQMDATTRLGSITTSRVRGAFQGRTESGPIKVERAGSWVHARTGTGDITIRLVPESMEADNHADLNTGIGNIILFLPEKMKATIDATIAKPALSTSRFLSNFPAAAFGLFGGKPRTVPPPGGPEQIQQQLNGGGNAMKLRTSSGRIEILVNR
jgi:DUF4097 and DUF4098 domain-containing protein YvlB